MQFALLFCIVLNPSRSLLTFRFFMLKFQRFALAFGFCSLFFSQAISADAPALKRAVAANTATISACAKYARSEERTEEISAGIDAMYNLRFQEAAAIFDAMIQKRPDDAAGYFFRSEIHLWKYVFDYSEPDYRKFLLFCDRAIAVAEKRLAERPDDMFAQTIVGAAYGFRALANFRAEQYVKAALDGRSCYGYLNDAVRKDSTLYDAYLGLGIFQFGVGALPSFLQRVLNLAGIQGNAEEGLRKVRLAAERSLWAKNDATLFLGLMNVYYKRDFTQGLEYLRRIQKKYPRNAPALYSLGNVELFVRKPRAALPYYQQTLEAADTTVRAFTAFAQYRIGECYWRFNDFEAAKPYFQRFFAARSERSFRGMALLRLALCYEFTGDKAAAKKGFERCAALTPFEPDDRFAARRAKEYLAAPPSKAQRDLIEGVNCLESLRLDEAEKLLAPLADSPALSKEIRAEAHYNLGEAARERKRYAEAAERYAKAIAAEAERETWIAPWSYYRLSEIKFAAGNAAEARKNAAKAKIFRGYDFEEWLTFLLERDLALLKG